MSKAEIYKEVYRELGYSDEQIDEIGIDEINLIMETSMAITVSQQYLLIDENGNQIVLSKEESLRAADAINAKKEAERQNQFSQAMDAVNSSQVSTTTMTNTLSSNDGYNEQTIGIMKIITRSDYINPNTVNGQKGHYHFSASYQWLTTPSQAHADAFSLYAAGFAWLQGNNDFYSKMNYSKITIGWGTTLLPLPGIRVPGAVTETPMQIEKYTQDRNVQSDGVFYTYEMPEVSTKVKLVTPTIIYSEEILFRDLSFYIRGRARVSNHTTAQAFNVFSRYVHLHKSVNWNTSFGWTVGSWPGVSVTPSVGNNYTTYASHNYTEYDPSFAGTLAYNLISNSPASYEVAGVGSVWGTDITIPRTYNGLPVTRIKDNAFSGQAITSVSFESPSNVTAIGSGAFSGCTQLTQISIPASVTNIASSAFAGCVNLEIITNYKIISNAQQLSDIRNNPNHRYKLANNITLSGQWTPIPNFEGILDGNGFTISGLRIDSALPNGVHGNIGLFAKNSGMIRNLKINNASLDFAPNHSFSSWSFAGFATGLNNGLISNVEVSSSWINSPRTQSAIGGIAGANHGGIIENCSFRNSNSWANKKGFDANGDAGGIVGSNADGAVVRNCTVDNVYIGAFHVLENRAIGGIIGYNGNASVINCKISNSTIENRGGDGTLSKAHPYMGKMIGVLDSYSDFRLGANPTSGLVVNVNMVAVGLVTPSQLAYFGTASIYYAHTTLPAQWGGVVKGVGYSIIV